MQIPTGWEDTQPNMGFEGFSGPNAGGHVLGIVGVEEKESASHEPMILLYLDIARGEFKNHYRRLSEKFQKHCYIRYYQLTEREKSIPYFKGLITAIEHSNPGYKWDWRPQSLVKKLVGANLREEEYVGSNGETKSSLKIAHFCNADKANECKVLEPKRLAVQPSAPAQAERGFSTPDDEDLPF